MRRGRAPGALARSGADDPRVCVSCDPATLARGDVDHASRGSASARNELVAARHDPAHGPGRDGHRATASACPRTALRLYEDDEVLAVDKDPHEPTTPQGEYAGSLLARVRSLEGAEHAVPIHRLDVGTSGVVFFARSPSFVDAWSRALHAEKARKIYVSAVRGAIPEIGEITRDLREGKKTRSATTRYRRRAVLGNHSLVEAIPEQGRTHQIRRHLSAIGHPVLGDERYGHAATNRFFEEKHGLDRTFLHCARVELDHPRSGKRLGIEAPLAGDLATVLERLA